jgi:hypothetical protein
MDTTQMKIRDIRNQIRCLEAMLDTLQQEVVRLGNYVEVEEED